MVSSWKIIACCAAGSFFVAMLDIDALKHIAKILAWISILLILASLIGIGVYCFMAAQRSSNK